MLRCSTGNGTKQRKIIDMGTEMMVFSLSLSTLKFICIRYYLANVMSKL